MAAADEVVVEAAVSAAGAGEEESAAALGAAQGAAQVVVVSPAAFAWLALRVEGLLHLVEGGLADKRLVTTRRGEAGVADDADVVVVAQDGREPVGAEYLGGLLQAGPGAQSASFEDRGEVDQRISLPSTNSRTFK